MALPSTEAPLTKAVIPSGLVVGALWTEGPCGSDVALSDDGEGEGLALRAGWVAEVLS